MNEPSGPQGPSAAHPCPSALTVNLGHFYLFPVICVRGQAIQETEWCSWDKQHFNPSFSGVVIQPLSHVQLFVNPWTAAHQAPGPSPTPGACSNSYPSCYCHPTISSSVVPFSSHLQSFPASGSFPMSQFFALGGQSIGVSASVLPINIQN